MRRQLQAGAILLIFHTVGVVGLTMPSFSDTFAYLSPFNLILTFSLFTWANQDCSLKYILVGLLISIFGISVEILGVKTGLLFGNYHYGDVLGPGIMGVPFIIGLNSFW